MYIIKLTHVFTVVNIILCVFENKFSCNAAGISVDLTYLTIIIIGCRVDMRAHRDSGIDAGALPHAYSAPSVDAGALPHAYSAPSINAGAPHVPGPRGGQ